MICLGNAQSTIQGRAVMPRFYSPTSRVAGIDIIDRLQGQITFRTQAHYSGQSILACLPFRTNLASNPPESGRSDAMLVRSPLGLSLQLDLSLDEESKG